MKPKLYYQVDEMGVPCWDFCASAQIGARELDIVSIPFNDILYTPYNDNYIQVEDIDKNPLNVVVGSVETTVSYLNQYIPAINRKWAAEYEKREIKTGYIDNIKKYPAFIKPAITIKDFTGFIAENWEQAKLFSNNYNQTVLISEPIWDIESEYRVYVGQRGIVGVKHYLGSPYLTLDEQFVYDCYLESKKHLTELSYTLDFGIKSDGETFLIEINDGWAIGNYGISSKDYYIFVRDRFLQLTGVLK